MVLFIGAQVREGARNVLLHLSVVYAAKEDKRWHATRLDDRDLVRDVLRQVGKRAGALALQVPVARRRAAEERGEEALLDELPLDRAL